MRKLLNVLLFLLFLFVLNYTNIHAEELVYVDYEEGNNGDGNLSYEIIVLNNIVYYNENINLNIISSDSDSSQSISITHPSQIVEQTISVTEGNTYLSFKNTHTAGEYIFDVNVKDGEEVIYSKELYIYSDGEVDCVSVTCIEECRDIYFTNFEASEEELIILGKLEAPEDYTFTKTYYEVETLYMSFVYEEDFITCDEEITIANNAESITVTGSIKWKDSKWKEPDSEDIDDNNNNIHNLINNYVYLYDEDLFSKDLLAVTQTDENGNFSFTIENDSYNEANGLDLFISFVAENDACKVVAPLFRSKYEISIGRYINVNNGSHINYDIVINKNGSVLTNSFEVSQMMIYPYEYAYQMSGEYLPQISVIYPNTQSGCHFSGMNDIIRMDINSYSSWDVGMHEYGHYVDHFFGFSIMPGGNHYFGQDLVDEHGKEHGLQLAYSEAIASYIGISTQLYFELSNLGIKDVGDFKYNSYNGANQDFHLSDIGEISEAGITSFLLMITKYTDSTLEYLENIDLEYNEVWKLLLGTKDNFSEFLENFLFRNFSMLDEISDLLVYLNFSPKEFCFPEMLDTNNENNIFSWETNYNTTLNTSKINKYSLIFYSANRTQIYEIQNIKDNDYLDYNSLLDKVEYRLTEEDFIEIMKLGGDELYVQVLGFNDVLFETGPYYGTLETISKTNINYIVNDIPYEGSLQLNEKAWFKFIAPYDGEYEFYSESYEDLYGELFSCIVPNDSINYMCDASYDQDYDQTHDFKISLFLEQNQVVYIRLRDNFHGEVREFTLFASLLEHECVYECVADGLNYHIYKCSCGETNGSRQVHTLDPNITTIIGGVVYKRCKFCQTLIKQNSSIITPVQGIKPDVEISS